MAYFVLDTTAARRSDMLAAQKALRAASEWMNYLNNVADEMTDEQLETELGLPAGAVAGFKSAINTIVGHTANAAWSQFLNQFG